MDLKEFKAEIADELEDVADYSISDVAWFLQVNEPTIKGCLEREMTAEETVRLILTGQQS